MDNIILVIFSYVLKLLLFSLSNTGMQHLVDSVLHMLLTFKFALGQCLDSWLVSRSIGGSVLGDVGSLVQSLTGWSQVWILLGVFGVVLDSDFAQSLGSWSEVWVFIGSLGIVFGRSLGKSFTCWSEIWVLVGVFGIVFG